MRDGGWTTANELADRLGVTSRSIRSYVAAINARVPGTEPIESGARGYRARPRTAAVALAAGEAPGPAARRSEIARTLVGAPVGVDVHELADALYVSTATVDADLAQVRTIAAEDGLTLVRAGSVVRLTGGESAARRFLHRLLQDESSLGYDAAAVREVLGRAMADAVPDVRRRLSDALASSETFVNEFAMTTVAVSIGVAAQRVQAGFVLDPAELAGEAPPPAHIVRSVTDVTTEVLGFSLPEADIRQLARMLLTRGAVAPARPTLASEARPEVAAAVREVMDSTAERFGVEGLDETFLARLALHVDNLQQRSHSGEWSHNPVTRTLKSTYPLLFDVAVTVATGLRDRLGIEVHDDEVAYLAMHIGGQWERTRVLANRPTAVLVSPGYYELHDLLRASLERALGSTLQLLQVHTAIDVDWSALDADIVLTTIAPPAPDDHIVQISPFLTETDIERVTALVARVRRGRRLAQLREDLGRWFIPTAFVRGLDQSGDAESVIRRLGALLVDAGVIDDAYVESAVAREQASSTAFTPALAVPHAMGMTAERTAIAVGIADSSIPWGDSRVQVVALVAFSQNDRDAFQTVFEQFVEVFADAGAVQNLVRRSVDLPSFLAELAAVIDG